MEKIFSTRVDDSVLLLLETLSKKLKKPKKRIIEEAIEHYAEDFSGGNGIDIINDTWGCWSRDESADETVSQIRKAFAENFRRHGV